MDSRKTAAKHRAKILKADKIQHSKITMLLRCRSNLEEMNKANVCMCTPVNAAICLASLSAFA